MVTRIFTTCEFPQKTSLNNLEACTQSVLKLLGPFTFFLTLQTTCAMRAPNICGWCQLELHLHAHFWTYVSRFLQNLPSLELRRHRDSTPISSFVAQLGSALHANEPNNDTWEWSQTSTTFSRTNEQPKLRRHARSSGNGHAQLLAAEVPERAGHFHHSTSEGKRPSARGLHRLTLKKVGSSKAWSPKGPEATCSTRSCLQLCNSSPENLCCWSTACSQE